MSVVFYGFLALGGLSLFGLATAAFVRWPMLVLYCIGGFTLSAWEFPSSPPLVTLGFVQVKPEDALVVTALTATVLRPQRLLKLTQRHQLLLLLIAISLATALFMGFGKFGPGALNEFRGFLWPLALTAWVLNQDWHRDEWIHAFHKWARITGLGLALLFFIHVALYGFGSADSFVVAATGVEQTGRPLVSSQALMLVLVGFLEYRGDNGKATTLAVWLGSSFILLGVLCQHRSVWAALAAAVLLVLLRIRGVALARLVVGGFFAVVAALCIWASGVLDGTISNITFSLQSSGTYTARVDTWTVLIDDAIARGPESVMFGEPFGFGYGRYSGGQFVTYAPHNWYVSVFLRLGLIGLALYLLLLISTLLGLVRSSSKTVTMIFVALAVYMWSYSLSWYLVPMLGYSMAVAFAARGKQVGWSKSEKASWGKAQDEALLAHQATRDAGLTIAERPTPATARLGTPSPNH